MIVAVAAMRVMEVACDEVVGVIAVGNGFMAAALTVLMIGLMSGTGVRGRAASRIGAADRELMVVDVTIVNIMQVSVVQVICVALVRHRLVTTADAVFMRVPRMLLAVHDDPLG